MRVVLELTRPARLRALQAPLAYAVFARALGAGGHPREELPVGIHVEAPERGRVDFATGEAVAFGLTLVERTDAHEIIRQVLRGLKLVGKIRRDRREHLGGNFRLAEAHDLVSGGDLLAGAAPAPVPLETQESEAVAVARLRTCTLRLQGPLLARRPRDDPFGAPGHGYLDARGVDASVFLGKIVGRLADLRLLEAADPSLARHARVDGLDLHWVEERRYGPKDARKNRGGVLGWIRLADLRPEAARALALGQRVGLGQGMRWGGGRYRIEELGPDPHACAPAASLLEHLLLGARAEEHAARVASEEGLDPDEFLLWRRALAEGRHAIAPFRRMLLQEQGGKVRTLSLPAPRDRALQRLIHRGLAPAMDGFLEASSHAYRRGRGRRSAADDLVAARNAGYSWQLRADFVRFFDSIEHRALRSRLDVLLGKSTLVDLLMSWVEAGAPRRGLGLSTGSPISPLLSNLFLDSFDEEVRRRGWRLVRYADDFLVLFRTREEADKVWQEVATTAAQLDQRLHEAKSRVIGPNEPFDFLGLRFEPRGSNPVGEGPQRIGSLGWRPLTREERRGGPRPLLLGGEVLDEFWSDGGAALLGPDVRRVHVAAGKLRVELAGGGSVDVPPQARVVELLGMPTLSFGALDLLDENGCDLVLSGLHGRSVRIAIRPGVCLNAELVCAQGRMLGDESARLRIARELVAAKAANHAALLRVADEHGWHGKTYGALKALAQRAEGAASRPELLGIEGRAARLWYEAFARLLPRKHPFARRVAPAARDPINALMNLGHTVIHRRARIALEAAGLCDAIGLVHEPRPGHPALGSDLQEPFRHLVDRWILSVIHLVEDSDFSRREDGTVVLDASARLRLLAELHRQWHRAMRLSIAQDPVSYQILLERQARALATWLAEPSRGFRAFRQPTRALNA